MNINGENKFLRITAGNLLQIVITLVAIVGLYYKQVNYVERIDGRVTMLERVTVPVDLTARVSSLEHKIDEQAPKLNNIARDVAWLVAREPNSPK